MSGPTASHHSVQLCAMHDSWSHPFSLWTLYYFHDKSSNCDDQDIINHFPGNGKKWQLFFPSAKFYCWESVRTLTDRFWWHLVLIIHICTGTASNLAFIQPWCVQTPSNTQHTYWLHTWYIPDMSSCIAYQLRCNLKWGWGHFDSCSTKCTFAQYVSPLLIWWGVLAW
jgi:hypothetical protein